MLGRLHHLILDTPEPLRLAEFYSTLLGTPITYRSSDFVVVAANEQSSGLGFQRAPDLLESRWPDPQRPQQMHLDVMVDDLDAASVEVLRLGARRLGAADRYVFADPSGHPFCLIPRPGWAPPVNPPAEPPGPSTHS